MEVVHFTEKSAGECIVKAVEVLQRGGVVLYPTDTLYGLGADAFSNGAVDKIYEIKGREDSKPIHCIVTDLVMAERYAEISRSARVLAKEYSPGALTLVLKKRGVFNTGITRAIGTVGIRIPNSDICMEMLRMFRMPITTTSANLSAKVPELSVDKILAQFGDHGKLIDLVIDAGELPESRPSTVVDVSGNDPAILREGAISADEIWTTLKDPR